MNKAIVWQINNDLDVMNELTTNTGLPFSCLESKGIPCQFYLTLFKFHYSIPILGDKFLVIPVIPCDATENLKSTSPHLSLASISPS